MKKFNFKITGLGQILSHTPQVLFPYNRSSVDTQKLFTGLPIRNNITNKKGIISILKVTLFIFGLLFTPLWATAQKECLESVPPSFQPEHEPRTLCQRYSTLEKYPNRFGTNETHYASQIVWNLNNGNDIFTPQ